MITEERIEDLALQVMLRGEGRAGTNKRLRTALRDAAREAAAAENEACAKLCEVHYRRDGRDMAVTIRARRGAGEGAEG